MRVHVALIIAAAALPAQVECCSVHHMCAAHLRGPVWGVCSLRAHSHSCLARVHHTFVVVCAGRVLCGVKSSSNWCRSSCHCFPLHTGFRAERFSTWAFACRQSR